MLMANSKNKINKTISITQDNIELIVENEIDNLSEFVNELILDALQEKQHMKRLLVKRLTNLQIEFERHGFVLDVDIKEKEQVI